MWKGKIERQKDRDKRMKLIKTKAEEPKFEMILGNVRLNPALLTPMLMNNKRM
jgi:hypothetical protein